MTIWLNEQIDPSGIIYSCIACRDEEAAKDCHTTWSGNLTISQKQAGWQTVLRTVNSWDEVPVNALKLSY